MKRNYSIYLIIFVAGLFQSCGVNSNVMFKVPKGEVNYDSIPMSPVEGYRISVDDKITFTLSTNDGADIIGRMSGTTGQNIGATNNQQGGLEYIVRRNGQVELPVIGGVYIEGLTVEECQDTLKSRYKTYQNPFIQVRVTNKRVIVFPGNGSDARVIPLVNANTTLMETIAMAGGITDRGKANTVKIIRKVDGERKIYGVDLSTIEGLKHVDMIVQANDYIYIEPTAEIAREVSSEIVPIVSLLSSALFIVSAINLLK